MKFTKKITYKCRACCRRFTLEFDQAERATPLLAQVSFHVCSPKLYPEIQGIGDAILFEEWEETSAGADHPWPPEGTVQDD